MGDGLTQKTTQTNGSLWGCNDDRIDELEIKLAERDAVIAELLQALEPFAHLARVMEEGQLLNFRGVYVSWDEAQAVEAAIAKARG